MIPVLGDDESARTLLGSLGCANPAPLEIIVVDGADSPGLDRFCELAGVRWQASPPGRGRQLAAGAQASRGDILWFLHADSQPPRDGVQIVRDHITAGHVGGWFRFRFTGPNTWYKRLLEWAINLRTRAGVPYGDQGLFLTRPAYEAAGGFPSDPLFEEVPLVKNARQTGRFQSVSAEIGVSPRRWDRDGWIRRTLLNRLLALGFGLGVDTRRLAAMYNARPFSGNVTSKDAEI